MPSCSLGYVSREHALMNTTLGMERETVTARVSFKCTQLCIPVLKKHVTHALEPIDS